MTHQGCLNLGGVEVHHTTRMSFVIDQHPLNEVNPKLPMFLGVLILNTLKLCGHKFQLIVE